MLPIDTHPVPVSTESVDGQPQIGVREDGPCPHNEGDVQESAVRYMSDAAFEHHLSEIMVVHQRLLAKLAE